MKKLTNVEGSVVTNTKGFKMTLITYRNHSDVDIMFECGTVLKNRSYKCFLNGNIRKPDIKEGQQSTSKKWGVLTLLNYHRYSNVDVQFEDGKIAYGVKYNSFLKGEVRKPTNRVGEKFIILDGYEAEIINYKKATDIDVRLNTGVILTTTYSNLKKGCLKNPYHPSVYGVGYMGVGKYTSQINGKLWKGYDVWHSFLRRSYWKGYHASEKSYKDVTVCDEWHNFQNFAEWFEENYKDYMQGWDLDKDIICSDCKIYSPQTCTFVPIEVNKFFIKPRGKNTDLPLGVNMNGTGFKAEINAGDKNTIGKTFKSLSDAKVFYKTEKEKYAKFLAKKWKGLISEEIYNILIEYKVEQ